MLEIDDEYSDDECNKFFLMEIASHFIDGLCYRLTFIKMLFSNFFLANALTKAIQYRGIIVKQYCSSFFDLMNEVKFANSFLLGK